MQQPPYPAGPNNSSNATSASATTTTTASVSLSSSIPAAAGTPVGTVYQGNGTLGNGTATFEGGAVRIGGGDWVMVGWVALVGSFVGGLGLLV